MERSENKQEMNVLMVISEPLLTRAIQKKLDGLGYKIDVANDGLTAWKMVNAKNYLLIIADFNLSGMSGVEFLERVKEYNGMTRVIFLIDDIKLGDFLTCFRHGIDDCFFKPLNNLDPLQAAIKEARRRLGKWQGLMQEIMDKKKQN